jgi:hypothetical protein
MPFAKRAQTCGSSAFFNREEHLTNPGISVISPGYKAIQELVLYKENGIFSLGQISRESGFPCRHLAAQENQLRCGAHALNA